MRTLSCGKARDMACELIDGELAPEDKAALEWHIANCATCPNLYRALVTVTTELANQRNLESDAG